MRKLILGIIAVVCLDIAFIVYPGMHNPAKIAYPTINHESQELATLADEKVGYEIATLRNDPDQADISTIDRKIPRMRRSDVISTRPSKSSHAASEQPLFKPIVITVRSANPTTKTSAHTLEISDRYKREAEGSDDRSFVSSVMPIVRKPYELIKYIGSKLR